MVDQPPPRLVDLVEAVHDGLAGADVPHGFGGAIALAYYVGEPRTTRDLDINIAVPTSEAESVFRALPPSVSWADSDVAECHTRGQVRLWAGERREGIPIDLFFPQHRFHAVVAEAVTEKPFARPNYFLPVIKASHLVVFKVLFDRPKDWLDIAEMLRAGTVNVAESEYWVSELLGERHPSFERLVHLVCSAEVLPSSRPGVHGDLPDVDWGSLS